MIPGALPSRRPLWILLAQGALVVVLVSRVLGDNRTATTLLAVLLGGAAILLAPSEPLGRMPVSLSLLTFVVWCAASISWSLVPSQTTHEVVLVLPSVVTGWCMAALMPWERTRAAILLAFVVVALANVVFVVMHWDRAAQPTGVDQAPGWHALFVQKNGLGFFALLGTTVLLALVERGPLRTVLLGASVVTLGLAQSMTAIAATAVVVSVHLWTGRLRETPTGPRRAVFLGLTVASAVGGVLAVVLSWSTVLGLFGRDVTLTGRTAVWASSIDAIGEEPWRGFGYGALWRTPTPPTEAIAAAADYLPAHAHNGVLEMLLEVGWVGLALYGAWCAAVFVAGLRARRMGHRVGHAVVLGAVAIGITSISEPTLMNLAMYWIAVLGGAATAVATSAVGRGAVTRSGPPRRVGPVHRRPAAPRSAWRPRVTRPPRSALTPGAADHHR